MMVNDNSALVNWWEITGSGDKMISALVITFKLVNMLELQSHRFRGVHHLQTEVNFLTCWWTDVVPLVDLCCHIMVGLVLPSTTGWWSINYVFFAWKIHHLCIWFTDQTMVSGEYPSLASCLIASGLRLTLRAIVSHKNCDLWHGNQRCFVASCDFQPWFPRPSKAWSFETRSKNPSPHRSHEIRSKRIMAIDHDESSLSFNSTRALSWLVNHSLYW